MAIVPDIPSFQAAQNRLRQQLGQDVDFMVRVDPVWPDDTALDADGNPYDPTIKPISGGGLTVVTKRASLMLKEFSAMRMATQANWEAIGMLGDMDAVIDLAAADYNDVRTAVQVWTDTLKFKIAEWRPSGLGGVTRWLVFLQEL